MPPILTHSRLSGRSADRPTPQVLIGFTFAAIRGERSADLGVGWRLGFAGGVDLKPDASQRTLARMSRGLGRILRPFFIAP